MRDPVFPTTPVSSVIITSGNQFQGGVNPGNQLQDGSSLFLQAGNRWRVDAGAPYLRRYGRGGSGDRYSRSSTQVSTRTSCQGHRPRKLRAPGGRNQSERNRRKTGQQVLSCGKQTTARRSAGTAQPSRQNTLGRAARAPQPASPAEAAAYMAFTAEIDNGGSELVTVTGPLSQTSCGYVLQVRSAQT